MPSRGPNRSTGVYSKRHLRRLVQQHREKTKLRQQLLINQIIESRTCSVTESKETNPSAVEIAEDATFTNIVNINVEDKIDPSDLTPVIDNIGNTIAVESSETVKNYQLEYDENDDECIYKDEEFEYRYSDDEDSAYETDEPDAGKPELELSAAEICSDISSKLKHVFAQWTLKCNISKSAQKSFLHQVRSDIPELNLPLDPRTLVKAPRIGEIHKIKGGDYCHFGLKTVFEKITRERQSAGITNTNIDLLINIDGAPLGNNAVKNLWPILCSENVMKRVYIIGVYCGKSKPEDVDEFLYLFVEEAKHFINRGFCSDAIVYNIAIDGLIFDAPAKAYILGVKCHSGYFSCTKCEIKGIYKDCVCFPGDVATLRTDEEFRKFDQYKIQGYQLKLTILNGIPNLGLVSQVPLDPMHLVLGIVRKFFLILRHSSTKFKLSIAEIDKISANLIATKPFVPYEFARKPRDLKDIKQFKATELRQIGLYTGAVALKNNIPEDVYDNFITMHVMLSIYSNPVLCRIPQWVDYGEQLGTLYVKEFTRLFGSRYVSHNMHNVQHLAGDVRRYGELENFSAFRFENFIAQIKRLLRGGNNVPEQLINRCSELEILQDDLQPLTDSIDLRQPHCAGPVPINFENVKQYKVGILSTFKLNCDDAKNNYVQIDYAHNVEVSNIILSDNNVYIVGRSLTVIGPLYEKPLSSSKLGINVLRPSSQNLTLQYWNIKRITAKLFIIPYKQNIVGFPILHTTQTM